MLERIRTSDAEEFRYQEKHMQSYANICVIILSSIGKEDQEQRGVDDLDESSQSKRALQIQSKKGDSDKSV